MDKNFIEKTGNFIRKNCGADDFTFRIKEKDNLETRFAQNAITQHMTGRNHEIELQVAYGNKTGTASINQLNDESLKYLIDTAQEIAHLNEPDPEYVPSEPAHELKDVDNFSEETENLTVDDIIENLKKCIANAEAKKAKIAGLSERHLTTLYVMTKNGFEGFDTSSKFGHSMTMKKDDVETKVYKFVKNYKNFAIETEIARLNSQFESLHEPKKIGAQKIPVILRPAAVHELFWFLYFLLELRSSDEGVTPYTDQLGKQFFGEKFSLASIMDDPDLSVPRFNPEGVPARTINWVNKGIIENMVVSRYYAKKKEIEATFPYNLFIEGGSSSEEEMMKMVDRGLIINLFWYIRFVDRKKGELTGMTRDGVLYFEDGEVKHSVLNLRFNEVPHEATRRILALGESILQDTNAKTPSMLIDDFTFVDTTSF